VPEDVANWFLLLLLLLLAAAVVGFLAFVLIRRELPIPGVTGPFPKPVTLRIS
jgi:hypothetical protein